MNSNVNSNINGNVNGNSILGECDRSIKWVVEAARLP